MFQRNPWRELIGGGLGRAPTFLIGLLIALGVGCVGDAIPAVRPVVERLRLGPAIWEDGELWRVVTYGFVGHGGISPWSVMQLVLVYWLGIQMTVWLPARRAQVLLFGGIAISGIAAAAMQFASDLIGGPSCDFAPFWMMQGQYVVIAIGIAAFCAHNRYSTVSHTPYLFGLPIPTKWLVTLQLLFAIGGYLSTQDLGGMIGIATATVWGWTASKRSLRPRTARRF